MVYKVSGGRTGRAMSFYMTGGELARTVGPLVIISAVSLFGFENYYPVMIFGILATGIMYVSFKDIPISVGSGPPPSVRKVFGEMRSVLLPLSFIVTFRGFMHASLTAFLPLFIIQQTSNVWLAGISLAIFEGAGVIGILTLGTLSDRLGASEYAAFFSDGCTGVPACFYLQSGLVAIACPDCYRFLTAFDNTCYAGDDPGSIEKWFVSGKRPFYDDQFSGPIGRRRCCWFRRRSSRSEEYIYNQCNYWSVWYSVYRSDTGTVKMQEGRVRPGS